MVRIAIACTSVRFERDDSEEARDSDWRFRMRSDDLIRLGRIQTGEAEEILDSGFLKILGDSPKESLIRSLDNDGR